MLIAAVFIYIRFSADLILLIIVLTLGIVGLVTLGLTANYLYRSLGLRIIIDPDKRLLEVKTRGNLIQYKISDVVSVDICEQQRIGLYGFAFDFARYGLRDGKCCIVTNLMTSEYYIPEGIQPNIRTAIVPLIKSRTNI
jgi:hypothetical protein